VDFLGSVVILLAEIHVGVVGGGLSLLGSGLCAMGGVGMNGCVVASLFEGLKKGDLFLCRMRCGGHVDLWVFRKKTLNMKTWAAWIGFVDTHGSMWYGVHT
jgi:hypothetical protein